MKIVARDYRSAHWVELELDGELIRDVRAAEGSPQVDPGDDWVAPAFWDIQSNGRWGHSFSSPELTIEQVIAIVKAQATLGTARFCPTLITAPVDQLLHGLRTIAAARAADPDVATRVLGIHLEGPFLSECDGYRGAHPAAWIRDPDLPLFEELQAASGRRIVLITIAPERPGSMEFIRKVSESGVVVALGHTAADGTTIHAAVRAGAKLSTHLGNGIVSPLPRHPNLIWEQAAIDDLAASFIADAHHLDLATLRVLARAKGPERTILIGDASPLAGLPEGKYGPWVVDPSGKILVAGTHYLAGSNQGLEAGLQNLLRATGWPLDQLIATVTTNPARLLGYPPPRLEPGELANLILLRRGSEDGLRLVDCCVHGAWTGIQRPAPV
jgi:N-acetylglucosamine-6-phosphate deacetylase